ncbi:MAG: ABC transporter permease [Ktedonobacteraceae bacterium]|nr:ABC transporter permease [Ktedonobacteraceae bacterium]
MKTLWSIAKKDLLHVIRDRNVFILLLIVPLALITVMGAAFENTLDNESKPVEFTVAVNNQDSGYIGETIIKALQEKNDRFKITVSKHTSAAQVSQQVKDEKAVAGIVVLPDASSTLSEAASKGADPADVRGLIQFYTRPNSTDERITITQQIVTGIVNRQADTLYTGNAAVRQVTAVCKQPGNTCRAGSINASAISKAVGQASPTSKNISLVELRATGSAPKTNAFDRSLPGFAVLFALFGLNTTAATILQEKEDGTFRRLLIAPVPRYALLGGKLLTQFLLTLLQLTILFTIGHFVFKLNTDSWQSIALLIISTSFATTGLGMLLVSLVKSRRQLTPVVTLTTLIASSIGGAWWPLWSEPQWMQQIAKIGITAWAIEGLNGVMIFGKSLAEVQFNILGLFGYGLICFLLALRLFRFQEQ